ncbi:hypothetical protein HYC85_024201 [Camellia sinensis]|uniref:Uncharacterized protein n=1 Tax=Camellia sinensis TaxID=4442 RepID=A0A7J7G8Q6_CAMSI|nr:hypothetical protein HYC85_024201 [Camellia sinensis]
MMKPLNIILLAIFGVAFLLSFIISHEACRVLDEEEEKSLRGFVPSFGPNPPTYIPASSTKVNTISKKNFVGHAMPPLVEEERMKNENLLLQSLRGPVSPLEPNLGTYIPTSNSKVNTISQKGFAGHAIPPPAYLQLMEDSEWRSTSPTRIVPLETYKSSQASPWRREENITHNFASEYTELCLFVKYSDLGIGEVSGTHPPASSRLCFQVIKRRRTEERGLSQQDYTRR